MTTFTGIQFHSNSRPELRLLPLGTSLALYAALLLVLCELFDAPRFFPAYLCGVLALAVGVLWNRRAALLLLAGLGGLAFLLSPVRCGLLLLINRLYAGSEAVNAYVYDLLPVSVSDEAGAIYAAMTALCLLLGTVCAAARRPWVALLLFLALCALEAIFGVTPALWKNLLLFAALTLQVPKGAAERKQRVVLIAAAAVILLFVLLLFPRSIAPVERFSEHLRDVIEPAPSASWAALPATEADPQRRKPESRQHEEAAQADEALRQPQQGVQRETELEKELSLPHRVDYLRIALLLLAVVAVLVIPFLPFLLLNHAKQRTETARASFAQTDNAAAIRAMFTHTILWLRRCGLDTENRPYAQCVSAVSALLPGDYVSRYRAAAALWQEAAYSDHEMTREQRECVRAFLCDTAKLLYASANARTRFRIRYIDGLCEG